MFTAEDVWFRYDRGRPWVLAGIGLRLAVGEVVGLCGPSGGDKSTLGRVLAGHMRTRPRPGAHRRRRPSGAAGADDTAHDERLVPQPWLGRYPHEISGGELQRVYRWLTARPRFLRAFRSPSGTMARRRIRPPLTGPWSDRMFRPTASRALIAVALSVSLAACGEAEDEPASSGSATTSSPQECETRPATVEPEGISADLAQKPEAPTSDAPPPCDLVIGDVVVGTGAEAVEGTTAGVQYVGAFYESGEEFDSSWTGGTPGDPLAVPVGQGLVIPGFEQAITGMKVGGRRIVTIPSELGYGPQGSPPVIPGNATLVFLIDLVEVT